MKQDEFMSMLTEGNIKMSYTLTYEHALCLTIFDLKSQNFCGAFEVVEAGI